MTSTVTAQRALDPQVQKLLKQNRMHVGHIVTATDDEITGVKSFVSDGDVTFKASASGQVVAIASGRRKQNDNRPRFDHNGNQTNSVIDDDKGTESFPSDIDSAAVTLTRHLSEDSCLRFVKTRACSMRGGNALLDIQSLWAVMAPSLGVMSMEFTGGTGDADNAKVRAIDAATKLNTYQAKTTKKRWQYITRMALEGMHPPEIARCHLLTAGVVRKELGKALDDVSRGRG